MNRAHLATAILALSAVLFFITYLLGATAGLVLCAVLLSIKYLIMLEAHFYKGALWKGLADRIKALLVR